MRRFPALGKCVKSVPHKSMSKSKGRQMISRREFIAATGAAVTVTSVAGAAPKIPGSATAGAAEKSSRLFLPEDDLKPSTVDRLPLEWHKQRAKLLQEKLRQESPERLLLNDSWNLF